MNPILKSSMLRPSTLQFNSSAASASPAAAATAAAAAASVSTSVSASATTAAAAAVNSGETNESSSSVSTTAATEENVNSKLNPFLQSQDPEDEESESKTVAPEKASAEIPTSTDDQSGEQKVDPLSLLSKNGLAQSNLFTSANTKIPTTENTNFVFGKNVHERVTADCVQNARTDENAVKDDAASESTKGGSLLFSSAVKKTNDQDENNVPKEVAASKSLTEAAREYEESREQKRKYEEVEIFTGEENERNIIHVNCKLFAYVAGSWEERGRGSLRLNDGQEETSRVVFRTSGNLKVLLNTKVWSGMVAEKASQKSLRLTALDSTGLIKIYLIMARPEEVKQLHKELKQRIKSEQSKMESITTTAASSLVDGGTIDDKLCSSAASASATTGTVANNDSNHSDRLGDEQTDSSRTPPNDEPSPKKPRDS